MSDCKTYDELVGLQMLVRLHDPKKYAEWSLFTVKKLLSSGLRVHLTETGEEFIIPPTAVGEDLKHQDAFIPYDTEQSAYDDTNSGEAFGEVGKRIHGKLLEV